MKQWGRCATGFGIGGFYVDKKNPFDKISKTGMILAAGFGKRMRPLSLEKPKPLLEVGGKPMLDYALEKMVEAGITRVVINAHYLQRQIEAYAKKRSKLVSIDVSNEMSILETGGGVKNTLYAFGDKPFFVMGGDLPFFDGPDETALHRMACAWDDEKMDVLLLLMRTAEAPGFGEDGDYAMHPSGLLWRQGAKPPRPYVYISAMIVRPGLYREVSETCFSNNVIFDKAEERRRLYGLLHDGTCYHVGTPEDLQRANMLLDKGYGWRQRAETRSFLT